MAESTADDLALIVYWRGKDRQELLGPVLTQWIADEIERVRREMEAPPSR